VHVVVACDDHTRRYVADQPSHEDQRVDDLRMRNTAHLLWRSDGVGGPRLPRPSSSRQKIKIIFPLQWKLGQLDIKHWNVLLQHSQLRECMGVLCTWVKLLTDLPIFGCELHKNAFGGPDPLREL